MRLIGEGLIALTAGEPRAALDYLLESLAGLPSIGGSRVQQEVASRRHWPRCSNSVRRVKQRASCRDIALRPGRK